LYELLGKVDEGKLYGHIMKMMGPNDPVYNQDKLDAAADYIVSQFKAYGLEVYEHVFELDGEKYRNIEGLIATGDEPELLVTSHYDTVPKAPGANDNLSGVSVMLEAARVLGVSEGPLNVRFIGFTLEEAHPNKFLKEYASAQDLGLMDENLNYRCFNTQKLKKKFMGYIGGGRRSGRQPKDSVDLFFREYGDAMNENELSYFRGLGGFYENLSFDTWAGNNSLIGSARWVEDRAPGIDIAGVLNLEEVGYYTEKPNTQRLSVGLGPEMIQTHLVDDVTTGNSLFGVGDVNSGSLLELFASSCKLDEIQLPYAWLHAPFGFDVLKYKMVDLLRSDHAPFWKAGIPAVMLTDTCDFRTPYYHTRADTIDKLDFGCMGKVCKATVAAALNSSSLSK
jgi:hypothetical protein